VQVAFCGPLLSHPAVPRTRPPVSTLAALFLRTISVGSIASAGRSGNRSGSLQSASTVANPGKVGETINATVAHLAVFYRETLIFLCDTDVSHYSEIIGLL
jgi:hypothetical protein